MERLRVGILFGGPSREREISFAGGRTVYDNLNKAIFEPVPIFIDTNKRFVKLNWQYVYKGTIRDFYPPAGHIPSAINEYQIYVESLENLDESEYMNLIKEVGEEIIPSNFSNHFDIAFLALHGRFGEDGQIQALLELYDIPYTGSGILPCSIGIDKSVQKSLMEKAGFETPEVSVIKRTEWKETNERLYQECLEKIGFPLVIRPSNQGSSIGVTILKESNEVDFKRAVDKAFFRKNISKIEWNNLNKDGKTRLINSISDIREGLGYPMNCNGKVVYHPAALEAILNESDDSIFVLEALDNESKVIVESFIYGKEFSCIVLRGENGESIALPPTEIIKNSALFDYKSKYLPGLSRKVTPIDVSDKDLRNIRGECCRLFEFLQFNTYARIDGFLCEDGRIYLNDPNTTSGMLPSSFFFHQAAEIGLNPSQFLTYIIRTSLYERITNSTTHVSYSSLLNQLDEKLTRTKDVEGKKKRVGVILGGYSFERHISVESGRNIYEKLASTKEYEPIPIFLAGDSNGYTLYKIPISLLLKDNADDIKEKIAQFKTHHIIEEIRLEAKDIMEKYKSHHSILIPEEISFADLRTEVDSVFIALHGRPGEDGSIQVKLSEHQIPYNGSHENSSRITINKFDTLQRLAKEGFTVARQSLIDREEWILNPVNVCNLIEKQFSYPLIVKPVDDGCSSAVLKIDDRQALTNYLEVIFRDKILLTDNDRIKVGIEENDEFPKKKQVLIEQLIQPNGANQFMEITVGLMTKYRDDELQYTIFEPSEALSSGSILSLEEKFLAGEGQNITPARFGSNKTEYELVTLQVKKDIERAARILEVEGYARVDAFVRVYESGEVETIIIEVNSLPGMTPATCIFHQAALENLKPFQFIDTILNFSEERNNKEKVKLC